MIYLQTTSSHCCTRAEREKELSSIKDISEGPCESWFCSREYIHCCSSFSPPLLYSDRTGTLAFPDSAVPPSDSDQGRVTPVSPLGGATHAPNPATPTLSISFPACYESCKRTDIRYSLGKIKSSTSPATKHFLPAWKKRVFQRKFRCETHPL